MHTTRRDNLMLQDNEDDPARYRVVKKFDPKRPGASKLARRYGPSLVCVRYRLDPTGAVRVTTVELVVERTAVQARKDPVVAVRIGFQDAERRAAALERGARWDPKARVWRMKQSVAKALRLSDRIVVENA